MPLLWLLGCRSPESLAPIEEEMALPQVSRILLVSIDTLRADHLGAWGGSLGLSPGLDRFVSGSLQFSQAHAHASWTKPSVASVMTSVLPRNHGVRGWNTEFGPDQDTLASLLSEAGWRTEAYVVHGAFVPEANEFERGFEIFDLAWRSQVEEGHPEDLETSAHLTDLAVSALQRLQAAEEPFFLWVHYLDPHRVYLPHEGALALGEDDSSLYAGEVGWTDAQLDRLLQAAEQDPELLTVFWVDHGEELGDHGAWGHAHTLYEELIHVPLALRVPGLPPRVDPTPVGLIDLAPTLLTLAGQPVPDAFLGESLLPVPSLRPIYAETDQYGAQRASIDWPYKLIWDLEEGRGELFHLEDDPEELQDLSLLEPARADALLQRLRELYPEIVEPAQ
jgi:choline-sulfatase